MQGRRQGPVCRPRINAGGVRVQADAQKAAGAESLPNQRMDERASSTFISSNALDQLLHEVKSSPLTAHGAIHAIELVSDVALVTVVTTQTRGATTPVAYRQTHLYRHDATGWTWTEPSPTLWGEPRTLLTQHLRFEYRLRDAPAVERAAHELDAMYRALRQDVGLPPPTGQRTVRVIPQLIAAGWRMDGQHLLVSSQLLMRLPSELSDAEALVQLLIDPFVTIALNETVQRHAIQLQWQEVVSGAQSWLHNTYCGERRVVRTICRQTVLPQNYAPVSLSMAALSSTASDSFALLGYRDYRFDGVALIDYVVAVYGRERLSSLLTALEAHSTWNTLIPAVFQVTAPAFEQEWQAYLRGEVPAGQRE